MNHRKSARDFYTVHFVGNYDDWKTKPLDMRRAMNLAVSANQLADWVLVDRKVQAPDVVSRWKEPKDFRDWLAKERCSDFRLVWAVAEGHKHMVRGNLKKPKPDKPVQAVAGVFQANAFQQNGLRCWLPCHPSQRDGASTADRVSERVRDVGCAADGVGNVALGNR